MRIIIVHVLVLPTKDRQVRCIWNNNVDWDSYYLPSLLRKKLTGKYVRAYLSPYIRESWECSLKIDSELYEKIEKDMYNKSVSIVSAYELEL